MQQASLEDSLRTQESYENRDHMVSEDHLQYRRPRQSQGGYQQDAYTPYNDEDTWQNRQIEDRAWSNTSGARQHPTYQRAGQSSSVAFQEAKLPSFNGK